jgi:amino acid adenylation domain-containing protein
MLHETSQPTSPPRIAIVGMSCRFAGGASSPSNLWKILVQGKDCTSDMPTDRWNTEAFYYGGKDPQNKVGTFSVKRGAFLPNIKGFDPSFFGISPREAKHLDPQQRLLLELAVESFEDAGIPDSVYKGSETGCYVGLMNHDYMSLQTRDSMTSHTSPGSATSIAANRVSYALDLRGPSLVLDTACSSSLVAVHLGFNALLQGDVDMALCGGINIMIQPNQYVALSRIGMVSPDGRCKSFASSADGYGRGEGGGFVVLKRYEDAVRDGNHVYCELVQTGVNSDGKASQPMLVPVASRHQQLMDRVYKKACIDPLKVRYVEAHGTGTLKGDPVEVKGIAAALGGPSTHRERLRIGTIKSNIGHTESAAGIAGLIKVALMSHHGSYVPSLHFDDPNPNIPFKDYHVSVQTKVELMKPETDFVAGINSFGFGGTNAHAIVRSTRNSSSTSDKSFADDQKRFDGQFLALSAKTVGALKELAKNYAETIESGAVNLRSLLLDSCARRSHYHHRLSIPIARNNLVAPTILVSALYDFSKSEPITTSNCPWYTIVSSKTTSSHPPPITFVFGGSGSEPTSTAMSILQSVLQVPYTSTSPSASQQKPSPFNLAFVSALNKFDSHVSQSGADFTVHGVLSKASGIGLLRENREIGAVCLLGIEWSLATAMSEAAGIRPDHVLGYSLGEFAAAAFCGHISLVEAIMLVRHVITTPRRAKLEGTGDMLSIAQPLNDELRNLLSKHGEEKGQKLGVAGINSPYNVTVAGDSKAIDSLSKELQASGILSFPLGVGAPYHCMNAFRSARAEWDNTAIFTSMAKKEQEQEEKKGISPHKPVFFSSCNGYVGRLSNPEKVLKTSDYWWSNVADVVQFKSAVDEISSEVPGCMFVELSPRPVLTPLLSEIETLKRAQTKSKIVGMIVVPPPTSPLTSSTRPFISSSVCFAALHGLGVDLNFNGLFEKGQKSMAHLLPTYPWQRRDYWNEGTRAFNERMGLESSANGSVQEMKQEEKLVGCLSKQKDQSDGFMTYSGVISTDVFPEIADHKFGGSVLFPGVKYIEIMMAMSVAVKTRLGEKAALQMEDIEFLRPLYLTEQNSNFEMKISCVEESSGKKTYYSVKIQSRVLPSSNETHFETNAQCILLSVNDEIPVAQPPSLESVLRQKDREGVIHKDQVSFYQKFLSLGFEYGSGFQRLVETWQSPPIAVALLRYIPPYGVMSEKYLHTGRIFDIGSIDSVLQSSVGASEQRTGIPVSIRRFRLDLEKLKKMHQSNSNDDRQLWVYTHTPPATSSASEFSNVWVYALDGTVVLEMVDLKIHIMEKTNNPKIKKKFSTPKPSALVVSSRSNEAKKTTMGKVNKQQIFDCMFQMQPKICRETWAHSNYVPSLKKHKERIRRCLVLEFNGEYSTESTFSALDVYRRMDGMKIVDSSASTYMPFHLLKDQQRRNIDFLDSHLTSFSGYTSLIMFFGTSNFGGSSMIEDNVEQRISAISDALLFMFQLRKIRSKQFEIWVVTGNDTFVANAVRGFVRVARLESPKGSKIRLLDISGCVMDDSALTSRIASLIVSGWQESSHPMSDAYNHAELRFDPKDLSILSFQYTPVLPPTSSSLIVKEEQLKYGTFLVVGGCGGLGLALAHWLVLVHGVRSIVLASRSGRINGDENLLLLTDMKESGAIVQIEKCDVCSLAQTTDLIQRVQRPPLIGVIHSAMVLDDDIMSRQTSERCRKVLAPKVSGAFNLHRALSTVEGVAETLKYFVLFSSTTSFFGNPGQFSYGGGNGFLDGLSQFRRSQGLPAVSVNWGAFEGVGYLARNDAVMEHLAKRGIGGITRFEFFQCFSKLVVGENLSNIAVLRVDWDLWFKKFPDLGIKSQYQALFNRSNSVTSTAIVTPVPSHRLDNFNSATPDLSRNNISFKSALKVILSSVCEIMEFASSDVNPDRKLTELGGDSLMAMELRTSLEDELLVEVEVADIFNLSLTELASKITSNYEFSNDRSVVKNEYEISTASKPAKLVTSNPSNYRQSIGNSSVTRPDVSRSKLINVEKRFTELICEIIEVEAGEVSLESKFTELGGDSLMAMELRTSVDDEFGVDLQVADIFSDTIRDLCETVVKRCGASAAAKFSEETSDRVTEMSVLQSQGPSKIAHTESNSFQELDLAPVSQSFVLGEQTNIAKENYGKKLTENRVFPLSESQDSSTIVSLSDYLSLDEQTNNPRDKDAKIVAENRIFPLSDMQAAYWVGRTAGTGMDLDGVACHFYLEFDNNNASFDVNQMSVAWNMLVKRHDMLRAVITSDGNNMILSEVPIYNIKTVNLRKIKEKYHQEAKLDEIRSRMSTNRFDCTKWPLFEIVVANYSLHDENSSRIYMDFDHLALDLSSVFKLLKEWGILYKMLISSSFVSSSQRKKTLLSVLSPLSHGETYEHALLRMNKAKNSHSYKRAKDYWSEQIKTGAIFRSPDLANMVGRRRESYVNPTGPTNYATTLDRPRFDRVGHEIGPSDWKRVVACAKHIGVTPTIMAMAAFAYALGVYSGGTSALTLNVTMFSQLAVHRDFRNIIGDLTTTVLVGIDLTGKNFYEIAKALQSKYAADMSHAAYSGVDVARDLTAFLRENNSSEAAPSFPVVFTSALDSMGDESNGWLGKAGFSVSATPQVLLDCTVISLGDGTVSFSFDFLTQVLPKSFVGSLLMSTVLLLKQVCHSEDFSSLHVSPVVVPLSNHDISRYNALNNIWTNENDYEYNDNSSDQVKDIFGRFEQVARKNMLHCAVVQGLLHENSTDTNGGGQNGQIVNDQTCTYGELLFRSSKIGNLILHCEKHPTTYTNTQPPINRLVVLAMEPSVARVAAILGVLWAGAGYVPLNPDDPDSRFIEIVSASGAFCIVTTSDQEERMRAIAKQVNQNYVDSSSLNRCSVIIANSETLGYNAGATLNISDLPTRQHISSLHDIAYVIYTSGSTGKPKGVMIEQCSALNTIDHFIDLAQVDSSDCVLGLHAYTFDLSVWDLFGSLLSGATLVIPEKGKHRNMKHVVDIMKLRNVTCWNSVPVWMDMLLTYVDSFNLKESQNIHSELSPIPTLKSVMLSGDVIPSSLPTRIRQILKQPELSVLCLGGPTEDTIWCVQFAASTDSEISSERSTAGSHGLVPVDPQSRWANMPYGVPIRGMKAFVMLNDASQDAPVDVWGEICFSGVGVSRGYLGDEERTNQRFVKHPISGNIMHRTGDVGKLTVDGYLLIAGRLDNQVKINGFRIELGEIEAVLTNCDGVEHSGVVVSGEEGRKQLIACVHPHLEWQVVYDQQKQHQQQSISSATVLNLSLSEFLDEYPNPKVSPIIAGLYKSQLFGFRRLEGQPEEILLDPPQRNMLNYFSRESVREFDGTRRVKLSKVHEALNIAASCCIGEDSGSFNMKLFVFVPHPSSVENLPAGVYERGNMSSNHLQLLGTMINSNTPIDLHEKHNAWHANGAFQIILCSAEADAYTSPNLFACGVTIQRLQTKASDLGLALCPVAGIKLNLLLDAAGVEQNNEDLIGIITFVCGLPSKLASRDEQLKFPYSHVVKTNCTSLMSSGDGIKRFVLSSSKLKEHALRKLPSYMVPTRYEFFKDGLPLSSNGKLDRSTLANEIRKRLNSKVKRREPIHQTSDVTSEGKGTNMITLTDIENKVELIWMQVLQDTVPTGGINKNKHDFFDDLGGDSLASLSVMSQVNRSFGLDMDPDLIFSLRTVSQMSTHIHSNTLSQSRSQGKSKGGKIEKSSSRQNACLKLASAAVDTSRNSQPIVFCVHPAGGNVLCYQALASNIAKKYGVDVYGLQDNLTSDQSDVVSAESFAITYATEISSIIISQEVCLVGFSFGGVIISEISGHLRDMGIVVKRLTVIDTKLISEQHMEPLSIVDSAIGHFVSFLKSLNTKHENYEQLRHSVSKTVQKKIDSTFSKSLADTSVAAICKEVWTKHNMDSWKFGNDINGLSGMIFFVTRYVSHAQLMGSSLEIVRRNKGGLSEGHKTTATYVAAGDTLEEDLAAWEECCVDNSKTVNKYQMIRMTGLSHANLLRNQESINTITRLVVGAPSTGSSSSPSSLNEGKFQESKKTETTLLSNDPKIRKRLVEILSEKMPVGAIDQNNIDSAKSLVDLGMNSLIAMQIHAQVAKVFSIPSLPLTCVLNSPTLLSLQEAVAKQLDNVSSGISTNKSKDVNKKLEKSPPLDIGVGEFGEPIAIIGASCLCPGATDLKSFWERLSRGQEMTLGGINAEEARDFISSYVEGFDTTFFELSHADSSLIDPQQRLFMECALEAIQDAGLSLKRKQGAVDGNNDDGCSVGVFSTTSVNTYLTHNLLDPDLRKAMAKDPAEFMRVLLASDKDYTSSRLAHALDLRGPAVTVQSACSSSLSAVMLACDALQRGRCHSAVVGGASIGFPLNRYGIEEEKHNINEGNVKADGASRRTQLHNMFSGDNTCRAFDAKSKGTAPGCGAACLILKKLSDAVRDGDRIMCCVVGGAMNNDGRRKDQFSQVSVEGQVNVLKKAYESVGGGCLPREHVGYIEGHGTGTALGDPVEVAALATLMTASPQKISETASDSIMLGSVKSNLGHLDAAAGAVGLLKVCLSLERGYIVPSINFTSPSPGVGADLKRSGIQVSTTLKHWPLERPLAGCSSFGMGGTNVHLVLASSSACISSIVASTRKKLKTGEMPLLLTPRLFVVSAKNSRDLCNYAKKMIQYAKDQNPNKSSIEVRSSKLACSAFTLQCGQTWYNGFRKSFVAKTWRDVAAKCEKITESIELLKRQDSTDSKIHNHQRIKSKPAIIFMFPGQGSQHFKMAKNMYQNEPIFRHNVQECCALVTAYGGADVLRLFFEPGSVTRSELDRTDIVQPIVFIVSYCLAELYMKTFGIRPTYMIGHSLGELVCATLSGVLDRETAISIVVERSRLMQSMPTGAMAQIGPGCSDQLFLEVTKAFPSLELAAHNTSSSYVFSGDKQEIKDLCKWFRERNKKRKGSNMHESRCKCVPLATSHAFHSSSMRPAAQKLSAYINSLSCPSYSSLIFPYVSNVTGEWQSRKATSADYWANHMCSPVRFCEGIDFLMSQKSLQEKQVILLEVGCGNSLKGLVNRHFSEKPQNQINDVTVMSSMPHAKDAVSASGADDHSIWLSSIGKLWEIGVSPNFSEYWETCRPEQISKISLPKYSLQKQRCFVGTSLGHIMESKSDSFTVEARPDHKEDNQRLFSKESSFVSSSTYVERKDKSFDDFLLLYSDFTLSDPRINLNDSFFAHGGSSMNATTLISRISKKYGIVLSYVEFTQQSSANGCWKLIRLRGGGHSNSKDGETKSNKRSGSVVKSVALEELDRCELPLSKAQRAIWYEERRYNNDFRKSGSQYNMGCLMKLNQSKTISEVLEMLKEKIASAIDKHPLLSARLYHAGDPDEALMPVLLVEKNAEKVTVESYTFSAGDDSNTSEDFALKSFHEMSSKPFDLFGPSPLIRLAVCSEELKSDFRSIYIALVVHHLVADGAALGTLLSELFGESQSCAKISSAWQVQQFRSFVQNESRFGGSAEGKRRKAWWKDQFSEHVEMISSIPKICYAPSKSLLNDSRFELKLPSASDVAVLSKRLNVTPIAVHLAAVASLIHAWTGNLKVCIGVPHANRQFYDVQNDLDENGNIGPACCVASAVPVLVEVGDPSKSFGDVIVGAFRSLNESLSNALPLSDIVRACGNRSKHGLFQVQVVYSPSIRDSINDQVEPIITSGGTKAQLPLTFRLYSSMKSERTEPNTLEVDHTFFSTEWSQRFSDQYAYFLSAALKSPQVSAMSISIFNNNTVQSMFGQWNTRTDTNQLSTKHGASLPIAASGDITLLDLIFDSLSFVGKDAAAIISAEEVQANLITTTYGEMLLQSKNIATVLNSRYSVKRGDLIALEAFRNEKTPVVLLGIFQVGAAYLPLSPDQPVERLRRMLTEAQPNMVIVQSSASNLWHAAKQCSIAVVMLEELEASMTESTDESLTSMYDSNRPSPDDVAYILYTSGSTGQPKGVQVTHRNAVAFLSAMQHEDVRIKAGDVVTCVHELLFDFSVWEIFGALCNGATVCVVPKKIYLSPPDIIKLCDRLNVTVLSQTPAAFAALEAEDRLLGRRLNKGIGNDAKNLKQPHPYLKSLRSIVFAGDKLDFSRLCSWFDRHDDSLTKMYNCYGITETSVFSSIKRITSQNAKEASEDDYPYFSLIGKPMRHNDFVILNSVGSVVPHGVAGELYIGGLAVAKGYLRKESLTAERFIKLPYGKGTDEQLFFKTGDIVRYTSNGEFDFLGRVDQQLKVRGFRVEAFEVEQAILSHSSLKHAVSVVTQSPSLLAVFYTLKETVKNPPSKDELATLARSKLPSYMVPQEFVLLKDGIPTTPNRKVDRKKLSHMNPRQINRNTSSEEKKNNRISLKEDQKKVARLQQVERPKKSEITEIRRQSNSLVWNSLTKVLNILCGARRVGTLSDSAPLPKFVYPSGGSLYGVQTYIVLGEEAWYYNPLRNSLQKLTEGIGENSSSRDVLVDSEAKIVLVGNTACIEPLYPGGGDFFVGIEAGCIYETLRLGAPHGMKLKAAPIENMNTSRKLDTMLKLSKGQNLLFEFEITTSSYESETWKGNSDGLFVTQAPRRQEVAAFYRNIEDSYLESLGHTFGATNSTEAVLDKYLLPRISPDLNQTNLLIADFGSGLGGPAVHIAQRLRERRTYTSYKVVGVTLTDNGVKVSDELSRKLNVSDITTFKVGDYHDLKSTFQDSSVDVVLMTNSLCHSTTPDKVLLEAHRCLKNGSGLLFVKDLYSTIEPMKKDVDYGVQSSKKPRKFALLEQLSQNFKMAYHTSNALGSLINSCGFQCEFFDLENDEECDNATSFVESCFRSNEITKFGEEILKNLPKSPETLGRAPFREGIWIAKKN